MSQQKGGDNLYQTYPHDFMVSWSGCKHLDCMPECRVGFCARLQVAFERWAISAPETKIAPDELGTEAR